MKLFAATCLASVFAESNIANKMERFRREAGYDTISFIDSELHPYYMDHMVFVSQWVKL